MSAPTSCLDAALALLARREHTVKELRTKLLRKFAAGEVNQIIEKLQQNGDLSDARYAAARVRYRARTSRWGEARIRQELLAKGVAGPGAEAAIHEQKQQGINFSESAKTLARREQRLRAAARTPTPADPALGSRQAREQRLKARAKLLNKLLRKGFSLSEARAAIAEAELAE